MKASLRYSDGYVNAKRTHYRKRFWQCIGWLVVDSLVLGGSIDILAFLIEKNPLVDTVAIKLLGALLVITAILWPIINLMIGVVIYKRLRWRGYRKP